MNDWNENARGGLASLLRFLAGYAAVLVTLLVLLPAAGRTLEAAYDALGGPQKLALAAVAACLAASSWWLARLRRIRGRSSVGLARSLRSRLDSVERGTRPE